MATYSYVTSKTRLKKSPIGGKGVFAIKPIKRGEIIAIFGGKIIKSKDYEKIMMKKFGYLTGYSIQVSDEFDLANIEKDKLETADFFNHSCDPNAGIKGQIILVAMKNIKPGEEITYDYVMSDGFHGDVSDCNCGAKRCRKTITGDDWRIPELQKKYKGYFSWYLQERINKTKKKKG